jgi:hypothetical protein
LRIGWDGNAFTFPMTDADGGVIGIRRRFLTGSKCSVRGSRSGLFVPTSPEDGNRLLICEGATDTGAALDLGFDAIGRPSCNSGIEMIARVARGRNEVVIVGDNDHAGRRGAAKLADALVLHCSVKVIYPPEGAKDLRQWLRQGLTQEDFSNAIQETNAVKIRITIS